MSAATYELIDEPRPGALSHLAVKPLWPLLAVMLGGAWISWPWFVLNGFAVGSPTRRRELGWALAGIGGSFALLIGVSLLAYHQLVGPLGFRYLLIGVVVYKLFVTYQLYTLQSRSFALYEHFGGDLKSGVIPLVIAALVRPRLFEVLPGFLQALFN